MDGPENFHITFPSKKSKYREIQGETKMSSISEARKARKKAAKAESSRQSDEAYVRFLNTWEDFWEKNR